MVGSTFLLDLLVIFCVLLIGLSAMFAAYYVGRSAWKERFAVRIQNFDGTPRLLPGQLSESTLMLFSATTLVFVNLLTPDISVIEVFSKHPHLIGGSATLLLILIIIYQFYTCNKISKKEKNPLEYNISLKRGYLVYCIYSIINFSFIMTTVYFVYAQFDIDTTLFAEQHKLILSIFHNSDINNINSTNLDNYLEILYGELLIGISFSIERINTLIIVLFICIIGTTIINFTVMGRIFEPGAVKAINTLSILIFIFVLSVISYIYLNSYSIIIDDVSNFFSSYKNILVSADSSTTERYYDILLDLRQRQGVLGFFLALTGESGGILLLLGGLQFVFATRRMLFKANAARNRPIDGNHRP